MYSDFRGKYQAIGDTKVNIRGRGYVDNLKHIFQTKGETKMKDYAWMCQGYEVWSYLYMAEQYSKSKGYYKPPMKVKLSSLRLRPTNEKFERKQVVRTSQMLPY